MPTITLIGTHAMSELRFSGELVQQLLTTLVQHDERAEEDSVATQYLAGTIGFLLGREERLTREQKDEILQELAAFAGRVVEDVESHREQDQQPQQPQAGESEGVWRPGMD